MKRSALVIKTAQKQQQVNNKNSNNKNSNNNNKNNNNNYKNINNKNKNNDKNSNNNNNEYNNSIILRYHKTIDYCRGNTAVRMYNAEE